MAHVFTVIITGDDESSKDSKDGRSKETKSKKDSVSALDLNNGKSEFVGKSSESKQKQQKQINKSSPENKREEVNARKQQKTKVKLRKEGDARPSSKEKEEEVEKKNQHDGKQPTLISTGADTGSVTNRGESDARDTKAPSRGKAKLICGCFGTKHKPLTNCLFCGRIACEEEGYNYCGHCGYLIEKSKVVKGKDGTIDSALLHKERLLKFDREFTKRTVIYDDQADYFSNSSSIWLNEGERANAEEHDRERRRGIHERKQQVLSLDL